MSMTATLGAGGWEVPPIDRLENLKVDLKAIGVARSLDASAVPVCLAPNGTVATNGVVTLGTALPATYSGGIWLRLPAGAVVGGAAGLYWVVMSSTTVGQVYTAFADPATEFIPYVPAGPLVQAVGSNVGYTQTTGADITLVNVTLPAGTLGPRGMLDILADWHFNSNANSKGTKVRLNTTPFSTQTNASVVWLREFVPILNRGSEARQVGGTNGYSFSLGNHGSALEIYGTVDTSVDTAINFTASLTAATDFIVLDWSRVSLTYGA